MQKILNSKTTILADDRERSPSIDDYFQKKDVCIKKLRLDVGDYILSERVVVERKQASDFVNSIINGRLFEQLKEIKSTFEKPILIIEGEFYYPRINENALKAAISSIILKWDIPIIVTKDEIDTAKTIYWLARKEQDTNSKSIGIRGKKKPKDIKELQKHHLSSLPGISAQRSEEVLKRFKTIKNFTAAGQTEIESIKGLGKKNAKKIYDIFNKEVDR